MSFQPGQLAGDYEVLDVLGKGGMGSVYRVRNVISDRIEAMKVLLEDIGSQPGIVDRFIAEIRTLARLDHPNIAKLHTAFKVKNQLVMVMEFVEGVDLAQRAKEGSIPVYKVVSYLKQVLSALGYAHNQGVVHRDIKPSNIMITSQGSIKLMDFGIAKSNAEPLLTKPGTTLGSLLYMSPEQVRGTAVDARSDIYSVGIVLYELTAGRCPFEADSSYEIMDAQLNTVPQPPVEINPSLPKPLNDLILTALQKDPAKRFQNADAFRRALDSISTDALAQTRLISETESFGQPAATVVEAAVPVAPQVTPAHAPPFPPPAQPASPFQAAVQPNKPAGRRTLWMALGAVACLCVLAAALIAVPHFRKTAAASRNSASGAQAYSNPGPDGSSPIRSAPASDSQIAPITTPAKADTVSNTDDMKDFPAALTSKNKPAKTSTQPAAVRRQASAPPTPAPTPAHDHAADQAQKPPAPPPGPSEQDLNNASEALMKMQARADAATQSLNNLKQQQAEQGLTLRTDMLAAETRMNSYLQMAQRSLQGRNLDLAQKSMDNAEKDLTRLENFLGR